MNRETFEQIFEDTDSDWKGDNAYKGLQILSNYTDELIQGADHDVIYGPDIDELIEAGITKEEVKELGKLNWIIMDDYLACYV